MRDTVLGLRWLLPILLLVLSSCRGGDSQTVHKSTQFLMGTIVEVAVVAPPQTAKASIHAVFEELKRVEDLTSFHKPSELSRINDSAGRGSIRANPEVFNLIKQALKFAELTGGAFEPTLGPLSKLWNFSGESEARVPEPHEVREALAKTGFQRIRVDVASQTLTLPESGMSLDLGGIAKGYALDRARAVLQDAGVSGALVNAGGDILAMGEKGPGKPWRIGIQDPRIPRGIVAVASVKDKFIVTSGDYERFIEKDGTRYHHILDPTTGYSARGLQSVTVIAPSGVAADALSTAVFVLGAEKGLKLIESTPDVEALIIDSMGRQFRSSGAATMIEIQG